MRQSLESTERQRSFLESPTFRLAYEDDDLLAEDDLRPLRLQLERLKPERERGIHSTVAVFGLEPPERFCFGKTAGGEPA